MLSAPLLAFLVAFGVDLDSFHKDLYLEVLDSSLLFHNYLCPLHDHTKALQHHLKAMEHSLVP